jgi:hypothetical protein
MATVMPVAELVHQLKELGTALHKLHQFTADFDEKSAPLLVRNLREATLDVIGWQVSCLDAAQRTFTTLEKQQELEVACHLLRSCNQYFLNLFDQFYKNLFTAQYIVDLERIGKKRGTGRWAQTALEDLYRCQSFLQKVCSVLLESWRVLADILSTRAPTLQATSIGQQFIVNEKGQSV